MVSYDQKIYQTHHHSQLHSILYFILSDFNLFMNTSFSSSFPRPEKESQKAMRQQIIQRISSEVQTENIYIKNKFNRDIPKSSQSPLWQSVMIRHTYRPTVPTLAINNDKTYLEANSDTNVNVFGLIDLYAVAFGHRQSYMFSVIHVNLELTAGIVRLLFAKDSEDL